MKLKVGDIELDSATGISFAGSQSAGADVVSHSLQTRVESAPSNQLAPTSDTMLGLPFPDWSARTYWTLCTVAATAAFGLALVNLMVPFSLLVTLMLIAGVPPLAGVALGCGLVARRMGRLPAKSTANVPDHVMTLRTSKIAALLASAKEPVSVEWIAESLGWTETAVVTGLRSLVEADRVQEDLDVDSGHWTYVLADSDSDLASRKSMPVAERERALLEAGMLNEEN